MTESATPGGVVQRTIPRHSELFFAFLGISLSGFGGVLPWARRMLVEQRKWLNEEEFAEGLALCQFLPGPNIVNLSVIVGSRFHGAGGAIVAALGLVAVPTVIIMICGVLYSRYGEIESLGGALAGLAAGAAGLIVAMALKMAEPLLRARRFPAIAVAIAGFVAVGLLRWPIYWVVLGLAPLGIALAWWRLR